jgi:alpha-beta hydrolase superfamily lysophospholipase
VLLLPQFNRTRKSWDHLASQLAAPGVNILTFDMRGIGERRQALREDEPC